MSKRDLDDDLDLLAAVDPAALLARVHMAVATEALCRAWVRAMLDGESTDATKRALRPEVEAFGRAWLALGRLEPPRPTVELAISAMVTPHGPEASSLRDMLLCECAGWGILRCALPRAPAWFAQVHKALMFLRCAVDRSDRGIAAQVQAVEDALQAAAAEQGVKHAEMRVALDSWEEVMGYPTIALNDCALEPAGG